MRLRGTFHGPSQRYTDPGDGALYLDKAGARLIADLELTHDIGRGASISLGAHNLFNAFPDRVSAQGLAASGAAGNPAVEVYRAFSPWGDRRRVLVCKGEEGVVSGVKDLRAMQPT